MIRLQQYNTHTHLRNSIIAPLRRDDRQPPTPTNIAALLRLVVALQTARPSSSPLSPSSPPPRRVSHRWNASCTAARHQSETIPTASPTRTRARVVNQLCVCVCVCAHAARASGRLAARARSEWVCDVWCVWCLTNRKQFAHTHKPPTRPSVRRTKRHTHPPPTKCAGTI